jgi:integrase
MATVYRVNNSSYYYAMYRLPVPSPDGKPKWKQVKKVTKETVRAKAQKAADKMEDAALKEAGAGDDGGKRIMALLTQAAELAAQKRLTLDLGRDFIRRMVEASTGEGFKTYTIEKWFSEWKEQRKATTKPATFKRYHHATDSFLTYLGDNVSSPLEWLTLSHVRAFRDKLHSEGRAAKTVNGYTKDVGSVLRAAVKEGLLLRSPLANLEALPEDDSVKRQPFTAEEVAKLMKHAPSEEWRGVILLGAYGGLRLGDAATLRWSAVDVDRKVIEFVPQKTKRKAVARRIVLPMHDELYNFFMAQKSSDDPAAPCFPMLAETPIHTRTGLSTTFSGIMEAAKVKRTATRVRAEKSAGRNTYDRSFHSLRHTFNSFLANGAVSQEMRMKLMGHTEADVNDIYTHLALDSFRVAVKAVPSLPKL